MSTMSYEAAKAETGAMAEFDRELDKLEQSLDVLTNVLQPVTNQYDSMNVSPSEPRPEPATLLHGRIERLHNLTTRLNIITDEVRL